MVEKPIQLIVGSYNSHVFNSDDELFVKFCKLNAENNSSNVEQKRDTDSNLSRSKSTFKLKQKHGKSPSLVKWDRKRHNKSNEQKESKDTEAPKELDALRYGLHSDAAPSWFTEYMESVSAVNLYIITKHAAFV